MGAYTNINEKGIGLSQGTEGYGGTHQAPSAAPVEILEKNTVVAPTLAASLNISRSLPPPPPALSAAVAPTHTVVMVKPKPLPCTPEALDAAKEACNLKEQKFAELLVLYRNKTRAYREAYNIEGPRTEAHCQGGSIISHRPHVAAYMRELESDISRGLRIDIQALLGHDLAIIEGHRQIEEMQRYTRRCCRYCHGIRHEYQWRDESEFNDALAAAMDANAISASRGHPVKPLPTDVGGYGFHAKNSPVESCIQCYGDGTPINIIADTTLLEGAAAIAFKGIRETKNGPELILHDVDKAKDRLLRACGAFGDDAASVARAAGAGAAAGASAAAVAADALRQRAATLSAEDLRKGYLRMASIES